MTDITDGACGCLWCLLALTSLRMQAALRDAWARTASARVRAFVLRARPSHCSAPAKGWDAATGLGSPQYQRMIKYL